MLHLFHSGSRSTCLDNEPDTLEAVPSDLDLSQLPGEIKDGDMQCKSLFGKSYYRWTQELVRDLDKSVSLAHIDSFF